MTCAICSKPFRRNPVHPHKRYCSVACRRLSWRNRRREQLAEERVQHPRRPPKPKRPRLICLHCGMNHQTDRCPRTKKPLVKEYGKVVRGKYIPPPGVKIRYIELPSDVHGDGLTALLKLEKGTRR